MGNLMSAMSGIFGSKEVQLLLLGLDNAGKTTLLYKLKLNQTVSTLPTVGFNVEEVKYKNIRFRMWDVGGQDKIRPLWRYYFEGTQAVIFMVDSADRDRLGEAGEVLKKVVGEELLSDAPLLVFANKQDLPGAADREEVAAALGLYHITLPSPSPFTSRDAEGRSRGGDVSSGAGLRSRGEERTWGIFAANAQSGEGLYEGLHWLSLNLPRAAT